ncbi:RDD family protein [Texcoconibacillus texcoconensis]|uniref:Putative RDD family membrane protein YckC n=1 Tax=Texcoconibacillus texcoconensis TaxID=1095777 RepID=A0A840QRF5_9BACI|nr:RDD family protein [Texcoconibacillus texcoconensis]MBB5173867.1 putative RDD family membrane protein YckC [Texcoconibacillus texcoconensis]
MYCRQCGKHVSEKAEFCPGCGFRPLKSDQFCQSCGTETATQQEMCVKCGVRLQQTGREYYAGFWIRGVAHIIDGVILTIPIFILVAILSAVLVGIAMNDPYSTQTEALVNLLSFIQFIVLFLFCAFYYAIFHTSKWQATPGKKMVGIKVTDKNGNRISFLKAFWRAIAIWFSGLIFYIGFIIAAFTDKKQALHDFMANTHVIRSK